MKKTLVIGLAAVITGGVAQAQEFSISTDITFASEYIFRGVKYGDNSLQPSVEVSSDQWYAGFWATLPLDNQRSEGWQDEVDFYAGFRPQVAENVDLDVGITHYYYTDADSSTEIYVGATSAVGAFTPGLKLYYDFDLEAFTAEGSVGFSIPMDNLGTSLDLTGYLGTVQPNDGDSYNYYGIDAAVPFRISENAAINFAVHWAKNDLDFGDDDHLWVTAGLTVGF